jgi:hypothetical protein
MAKRFIDSGLTVQQLRDALDYDHTTGRFYWRRRKGVHHTTNVRYAGKEAGHRCPRLGYVLLGFNGRLYRAHRLAWLYVFGEWPAGDLDHINGDGFDNRTANLREATRTQNNGNMRMPSHNTSGLKGAYWDKRAERWMSQIKHQGRQHYLGYFDTAEQAHAAYAAAAVRLHGEFARID